MGREWLALAANRGDDRFEIGGLVPVRLIDDGEMFDTVVARFDGGQFWFDELDARADSGAAAYLRESLGRTLDPRALDRKALTGEQRTAYAAEYARRLEETLREERARPERRLRVALEHAGARLRDFGDRGDVYRVTFSFDGRRHTSVVRKDDLSVVTAGICLSGQDGNFDLASLVGVLREGETENRFFRT
jgi:hypothetical protein